MLGDAELVVGVKLVKQYFPVERFSQRRGRIRTVNAIKKIMINAAMAMIVPWVT